jgi:hypothetical protein
MTPSFTGMMPDVYKEYLLIPGLLGELCIAVLLRPAYVRMAGLALDRVAAGGVSFLDVYRGMMIDGMGGKKKVVQFTLLRNVHAELRGPACDGAGERQGSGSRRFPGLHRQWPFVICTGSQPHVCVRLFESRRC